LKPRLKNLNGKGNEVISCSWNYKKTKIPLGLNNNKKKPLGNDNQAPKANANKFS